MRRILLVLCLVCLLVACAGVSRYEKGALTAHGERLGGAGEVLYYALHIRLGSPDDTDIRRVRVRLATGAPVLPLADLTPATVAKYLPRFVPPPQWPEAWKKRALAEDAYSGGGFHLRFEEGRLVSVGLCSHCAEGPASPVVGSADGQRTYALPLTRAQLVDVFGEPARERRVQEVRY